MWKKEKCIVVANEWDICCSVRKYNCSYFKQILSTTTTTTHKKTLHTICIKAYTFRWEFLFQFCFAVRYYFVRKKVSVLFSALWCMSFHRKSFQKQSTWQLFQQDILLCGGSHAHIYIELNTSVWTERWRKKIRKIIFAMWILVNSEHTEKRMREME